MSLYISVFTSLSFLESCLCSAISSVLIVGGLYMVLWGKGRETSSGPAQLDGSNSTLAETTTDLELNKADVKNGDADSNLPV